MEVTLDEALDGDKHEDTPTDYTAFDAKESDAASLKESQCSSSLDQYDFDSGPQKRGLN